MAGRSPFMFVCPTLPKAVYDVFKALRDKYQLSTQQMVIVAVITCRNLGKANPEQLEEIVFKVRGDDLFN